MNLAELLTATASEHLDDRTDLIEGDPDSQWSDNYLIRMFNEAQRLLCRRAWVIIDTGVAPAGVITLMTDKVLYPYHKSVLRVFDVTPSTQDFPLGRADDIQLRGANDLSIYPAESFTAFEVGEYASRAGSTAVSAGVALAIASDAGTRTLRVFPPPTSTQNGVTVSLKVARMPTTFLTADNTEAFPEVPEEFHDLLVKYAAGRALTLPNVDQAQKKEGRDLLADFDAGCREARRDRQRVEMGTNRWQFSSQTATLNRG